MYSEVVLSRTSAIIDEAPVRQNFFAMATMPVGASPPPIAAAAGAMLMSGFRFF